MINGWFCRSVAGDQGDSHMVIKSETSEEEPQREPPKMHMRYKNLKKKLKFLIYENEFLADTLRTSQNNFLKIAQDREFLLNRLLQYEKPGDMSSSESNDETDSSDDDAPMAKKKKLENSSFRQSTVVKRKKIIQKKSTTQPQLTLSQQSQSVGSPAATVGINNRERENTNQKIMTTEEVERHLQSRQSLIELLPEPTVPTEMFEPSLDGESND